MGSPGARLSHVGSLRSRCRRPGLVGGSLFVDGWLIQGNGIGPHVSTGSANASEPPDRLADPRGRARTALAERQPTPPCWHGDLSSGARGRHRAQATALGALDGEAEENVVLAFQTTAGTFGPISSSSTGEPIVVSLASAVAVVWYGLHSPTATSLLSVSGECNCTCPMKCMSQRWQVARSCAVRKPLRSARARNLRLVVRRPRAAFAVFGGRHEHNAAHAAPARSDRLLAFPEAIVPSRNVDPAMVDGASSSAALPPRQHQARAEPNCGSPLGHGSQRKNPRTLWRSGSLWPSRRTTL